MCIFHGLRIVKYDQLMEVENDQKAGRFLIHVRDLI